VVPYKCFVLFFTNVLNSAVDTQFEHPTYTSATLSRNIHLWLGHVVVRKVTVVLVLRIILTANVQSSFMTNCNTGERHTACRQTICCECTVRDVVGCNSSCVDIADMFCSKIRYLALGV